MFSAVSSFKFKWSVFEKSLTMKFVVALILVLAVSFTGLSVVILQRQKSLLNRMSSQVGDALTRTGEKTHKSFEELAQHVDSFLGQMRQTTSENIKKATEDALVSEEDKVKNALEFLLVKNAEGISALLNTVVPNTVMTNKLGDLIRFSKAAAQTDEIVFALFFDKEGEPYPGYLNAKDPKIMAYRETKGFQTTLKEIVENSKKDPGVMVIEEPIKYFGTVQGKTVICMNRDTVEKEISALGERFHTLNETNGQRIHSEIKNGSNTLKGNLTRDLDQITAGNTQAMQETRDILKQASIEVNGSIRTVIIVVGLVCSVVILVLIGFLLKVIVINPIREVSDGLKDTARGEGDLTKRLALDRKDEIGILAGWFDAFLERLNTIILDINTNAGTVAEASEEVLSNASGVSQGTQEMSAKAATVAAATEEMSANMESVAAASEQTATNVKQVSDNADQMRSTLVEVAQNCSRAREVADNASQSVEKATKRVEQLGEAAKGISKVTEVITDIAEQTNLLALNATIEAARAGTAGKGFAVVASEIKGLAAQTADATQDIRSQIQGIQASTDSTVEEVGLITKVIAEVNEIVTTIAAAVEEQSSAAAMVAENVSQASSGIDEVNTNVSQSSHVASEIAGDIAQVNSIIETMSGQGNGLAEKARELSELSGKLKEMISVFKVSAAS